MKCTYKKEKNIAESYMSICNCWRIEPVIPSMCFLEQLHSVDWMTPFFNELAHSLYKRLGVATMVVGLLRSSSPIHR